MPSNYSSIRLYTVVEARLHLQAAPPRLLILDSRALILQYRTHCSINPGPGGTIERKAGKKSDFSRTRYPSPARAPVKRETSLCTGSQSCGFGSEQKVEETR